MPNLPPIPPSAIVEAQPSSAQEEVSVFSWAEYEENTARVVAHAEATGRAVVVGSDGRPRVIITIPTRDLPTLDE